MTGTCWIPEPFVRRGLFAPSERPPSVLGLVGKLHQINIGNGEILPVTNSTFDEGPDISGCRAQQLPSGLHAVYEDNYGSLMLA